ncbi:MAG: hypothetical protein WB987_18660 [Candidatus Acidiferrales bacterium]
MLAAFGAFLNAAPQQPPHQQSQPQQAPELQRFALESGVSIELGPNWKSAGAASAPPPGGLGPYAPPFHFNQILFLSNQQRYTVLQLATSDNPLVGHDAYWLDTQMHSMNGTGMSLPDYLFFLFLPPTHSCMDDVLAKLTEASRAPKTDGKEFSQSELQVSYTCTYSPTLSDFYSQQLTTGITFRQALNGPRAYGDFKNLDLPPMEQVDFSGMTFFVFEAQSHEQISEKAVHYFNLPVEMQGLHADFFWAVGAASPYPFVTDPARKNSPIIHLAYAGAGPNKRADFLRILQRVRTQ